MIAVVDLFLMNSTCTSKKEEKIYLLSLFGNKRLITTLIYRGSIHGWKFKDFHTRCGNKGPTISLFKVKDGDCIGGYTNASWSSAEKYGHDNQAMLFNLSSGRYFPSLNNGKEIWCAKNYGPCFHGGKNSELSASHSPFNGDLNCSSSANNPGYGIPLDVAGINTLTNKMDGAFTIIELEVWEVTYIDWETLVTS